MLRQRNVIGFVMVVDIKGLRRRFMKLYGKKLNAELAKRKKSKEERRAQGLSIRIAAKQRGISVTELLAFEYGYDCCPHKEWKDQVVGFPMPKLIFKACKKCGKPDEATMEKVADKNMDRVYSVYKKIYGKNKIKGATGFER